ncbi:MAG: WbqC family protein [Anaerolineae bacterium]|nr:WbqC family protein [Anaerolineae bacterium]
MKKVVISQPMFFPWVGMLEQIKLSDVYIYYDDVQFSKGSFTNRVQIKTADGFKWLTVPVNIEFGQTIREVRADERHDWRTKHLAFLEQTYRDAPFVREMLTLVQTVYERPLETIAEISIASTQSLCTYFDLTNTTEFMVSSTLNIGGHGSRRVLDIVRHVAGDIYITGHGAKDYLEHSLFEDHQVRVEYMDYEKRAYPQLYGSFTPYLSALDLAANLGREGRNVITSASIYWREFLNQ